MPPQPDHSIAFDPVAAFLRRPLEEVVGLGEQAAPLLPPASPEPQSLNTLHKLAQHHAWAAVLNLSTTLLAASDAPSPTLPDANALLPHQRLLSTLYRALALVQTRQLERASTTLSTLGDLSPRNPDYCFQTFPLVYPEQTGSFVPFELTLLAIDVRVRQGDASAILDAYALLHELKNDSSPDVTPRIPVLLSALASYHLKTQQWDAAVDVARQLTHMFDDSAPAWYMYTKTLLHVGDLDAAQAALLRALSLDSDEQPGSLSRQHAHKAMLLAARAKYPEAIHEYETAAETLQRGTMLDAMVSNNLAICLVHVGRLADAVDRLENALRRGPNIMLDEGLVFNLATLYDIAFPDTSADKKHTLQRLASRFGRQGFDLENVGLS